MQPVRVVKTFNKGKQIPPRLVAGSVGAVADELGLERVEEALGRRVVERIATPAHRADEAGRAEVSLEGLGGVLHAAIGMVDQPRCRSLALNGHGESGAGD